MDLMKRELFSNEDYRHALREHSCVVDCLKEIEVTLQVGDLEKALERTVDMHISLIELSRMAKNQQSNKRLEAIAKELRRRGIQAGVIYRV